MTVSPCATVFANGASTDAIAVAEPDAIADKLADREPNRVADGATDDCGYRSIENRTQTADLHATILHQLGLDHEHLVYSHNGRDERLTDVYEAKVIRQLIG